MIKINLNSYKSVRIEILAELTKVHLSWASGFLAKKKNKIYLITNWHVFTGKNFETKELLHPSGAIPGFLNITYFGVKENEVFQCKTTGVPLYKMIKNGGDHEATDFPLWKEHPEFGSEVDVVALDITNHLIKIEDVAFDGYSFDCEKAQKTDLLVMDNVFIVGYPLKSSTTPNDYPIYKGATIASEPNKYDKLPIFYVDGKTKSGMSGSPVLRRQDFDANFEKRGLVFNKGKTTLVGVYSGRERVGIDEYEAELGIVWRIDECVKPLLNE